MDEAAIVINRDWVVEVYNQAADRLFGAAPAPEQFAKWELACGVRCETPDDLPWRRVLRGAKLHAETYLVQNERHPSGLSIIVKGQPRMADDGAVTGALLSVRRAPFGSIELNQNEHLERESRLQQSEKMDAIARLAGGVAHDFNNLLTVISGYGQMLQDALDRDLPAEKMQNYLEELMNAGTRAAHLTDQLLAFSRRKVTRPRRFDLCKHVKEVDQILSETVGENADFHVETSPEPCYVHADPEQVTQVILTLAAHARDNMPLGGLLTLRTSVAGEWPSHLKPHQRCVLLEVSDTGKGTDAEILPHIFEPFFTSKSHGRGTGLGLATVYGIVKQIGGEIVATSEPGFGTTFLVYLPITGEPGAFSERVVDQKPARKQTAGEETILLVDDDATVRTLVKTMLESFGYRPLVADGGRLALDIFHQHRAEIQLLLTDVIMPQMSGRELAVALRRSDPNLKILYMSGYTADETALQGLVNVKPILLQKPFNAEALAQRVREVLDSPAYPN